MKKLVVEISLILQKIGLNFSNVLQFILSIMLVVDTAEWHGSCENQVTLKLVLECGLHVCIVAIMKCLVHGSWGPYGN